VNPEELLAGARDLASAGNRRLGASRSVGAALLARQALETAIDDVWARTVPGLAACSARAQLIALPTYVPPLLAGDVAYCWSRLSRACHHDAYELPPAPAELEHLLDIVDELLSVSNTGFVVGQPSW